MTRGAKTTSGGVLLAIFVSSCGTTTGPADDPDASPVTFLSFTSDPGDWVGAGESRLYEFADGTWGADYVGSGGAEHVTVFFRSSTEAGVSWLLRMGAREGETLAPGKYESVERFRSAEHPELSFFGSGRGCNRVTGRFEIHSIRLGASNTLARLHATFTQHCEGGSPALNGEISIAADPWR